MHIITIMNYKERSALIMCKAWIYFAKRFNPKATISIFYHDDISQIRQFASYYLNISFVKIRFPKGLSALSRGHTHHPAQDLRLALWKQLELLQITKFIYIDADAFILGSLNNWWNIIDLKPYIAIPECRMPSGRLRLNAGVHSYCDQSGFITYDKLINQYKRDGNRILVEAGEQGLIYSYFRRINYTYTHPTIDYAYNSIAKYCRVVRADDREIVVYSGSFPMIKKIARAVQLKKKDFSENWLWWNNPTRVKILHAFGGPGPGYKFWELPECKSLWRYCIAKTSRAFQPSL